MDEIHKMVAYISLLKDYLTKDDLIKIKIIGLYAGTAMRIEEGTFGEKEGEHLFNQMAKIIDPAIEKYKAQGGEA